MGTPAYNPHLGLSASDEAETAKYRPHSESSAETTTTDDHDDSTIAEAAKVSKRPMVERRTIFFVTRALGVLRALFTVYVRGTWYSYDQYSMQHTLATRNSKFARMK